MKLAYGLSLLLLSSPHVASYDGVNYKRTDTLRQALSNPARATDSSAFNRHDTRPTHTPQEQYKIFFEEFLPDALEKLRITTSRGFISRGDKLNQDLKTLTEVREVYLTHYKNNPALKQMIDRLISDIRLAVSKEIIPTAQKIYDLLPQETQDDFRAGVRVTFKPTAQTSDAKALAPATQPIYHTGDVLLYTLQEIGNHFGTCTTRTKCLEEDRSTIRRVIRMLSAENPARLQLENILRVLQTMEEELFDSHAFLENYQQGKVLIDVERLNWKNATQDIRLSAERSVQTVNHPEEQKTPIKKKGTVNTLKDDFKDSIEKKGKQLIEGFLDGLISSE